VASATATPTNGEPPLIVKFQGDASDEDGTISVYYWTFGDGSTSVSQNPGHRYERPGNYIAVLTVKDDDGAKACAAVNVSVGGAVDGISPRPPTGVRSRIISD
jgi:PKD repeat protein